MILSNVYNIDLDKAALSSIRRESFVDFSCSVIKNNIKPFEVIKVHTPICVVFQPVVLPQAFQIWHPIGTD